MSLNSLRGLMEWALMVGMVFGAGAIARAQNDQPSDEGVVQIGRTDDGQARPNLPPPGGGPGDFGPDDYRPEMPKYWIGLMGGAIPAEHPLRSHVDLPEGQGLLVENVVPDSPAAKAGLKKHDIMLRANDMDLHEMQDLVGLVAKVGDQKGQITIEVLRHGKKETVNLTPTERPANAPQPQGGVGFGGGGNEFGVPDELLQRFGGQVPQFNFRTFGPGVIVGGGQGMANMPNGVSISVTRENDQPPHITVKRGSESWEVVGDDPESLKKLPNDLRPFVEQMLHGFRGGVGGRAFNLQVPPPGPDMENGRLRERLEQMEKRMQNLMDRLDRGNRPAEQSNDQKDQAK
jgi:membrane-associated protease RseP (regulator of RpoE activity)